MTGEQLLNLEHGDIVHHVNEPFQNYTVMANYGDRVTAVKTVDITNEDEWIITRKAKQGE